MMVFVEFFADFSDVFIVPAAWRACRTGLILDAQIPLFKARKLNTRARLRACSLKASWSISNDSVGVFPRRKQNLKQILCSFKSWFRQGHKNYLHENCPCGRLSCYRKTSVLLLTVEGLRNKHWRPSPTPPHSAALRLVLFFLGPPRIKCSIYKFFL